MIREIRIYVEGGGDVKETKRPFRIGMQAFLKSLQALARRRRIRWNVIVCGSRRSAYDAFCNAIAKQLDSLNILLVDSERPVTDSPWDHLRERDGWARPECSDEQCHLMVQFMETWFVADADALEQFYGNGFRRGRLPRHAELENVAKDDILTKLNNAVRETSKKRYHKTRHGPRILELLSADTVRSRAGYCERLFFTIEHLLENKT